MPSWGDYGGDWCDSRRRAQPGVGRGKGRGVTKPKLQKRRRR